MLERLRHFASRGALNIEGLGYATLNQIIERKWAEVVIDECAAFPNGAHDDYVDTCTNPWQWVRRLGEVDLWEDEDLEDLKSVRDAVDYVYERVK